MKHAFPPLLALLVVPFAAVSSACNDGVSTDSNIPGGAQTGGTTGGGGDGDGDGTGGTDAGGAGSTNDPELTDFELLWEDDFDTIDTARWQKASHTFEENAAQFDPANVTTEDGFLKLRVEKVETPSSEGKLYRAGELRTIDFYGYGRFETRARFAAGSGIVSSLFTYYDHWADPALEENWNEIDIEHLGNDPQSIQFNVIHWNESSVRTTHEKHVDVGFSPSESFHEYAIEWLPEVVHFYIDGELVHSQTEQIAEFLTLDSRVMMNAWPVADTPDLTAWAGAVDDAELPTVAEYDWVKVYRYTGQ